MPDAPWYETLFDERYLAFFPELQAATRAVVDLLGAGLLPSALEIVDQNTIRAVEASIFAAGYPTDAGAALVVEFDGIDAGLDAEAQEAKLEDIVWAFGYETDVAQDMLRDGGPYADLIGAEQRKRRRRDVDARITV